MAGYYPRGPARIEFWKYYWQMLHLITFLYSDDPTPEQKNNMVKLFERIATNLPYKCKRCIHHYKTYLGRRPIADWTQDKQTLIGWLIDLHNEVNRTRGRPTFTREQINLRYQDPEAINQELRDRYELDIMEFLNSNPDRAHELVNIGHHKIIRKIIQRNKQ